MYCLNDFEMVPVAPVITGITFAFTFHIRRVPVVITVLLFPHTKQLEPVPQPITYSYGCSQKSSTIIPSVSMKENVYV
jgi:hypothetical protein